MCLDSSRFVEAINMCNRVNKANKPDGGILLSTFSHRKSSSVRQIAS